MDAARLRRLGADPDATRAALTSWMAGRPVRASDGEDVDGHADAVLEAAHLLRELDGGGVLLALEGYEPAEVRYERWGARRALRFARDRRMLTTMHAVHLARLARARAGVTRRRADVRLHGMSFLGRDVELTAPRGEGRLVVGPWCWIGDRVALRAHHGRVTVGAKAVIGGGTTVNAHLDVTIGEGALIADDVHITDFDHRTDRLDLPIKDQGIVTSPVRIGPDVWLGRGVTVLRGVDIGRGSVIGAHAVVTREVPPYSVAVGAPARVVRSRRPVDGA